MNDCKVAREESAQKCIEALMAFHPNCAVCHVLGGRLTGRTHKMCFRDKKGELETFYRWNKPRTKDGEVGSRISAIISIH